MSGLSVDERRVFDHLIAAIAERRLAPDVRLVEADLAQTFDLSRGQIRKVLLALEQTQVVQHTPNRGAKITRLSVQQVRGVIDARALIEPEVVQRVALLAPLQRGQAVSRLTQHIELEHRAVLEGSPADALRLSGRFHVIVCEVAGNPTLAEIVDRLVLLSSLGLATHAPAVVSDHCGPHEHEMIVAAIAHGDAAKARELTAAHLLKIAAVLPKSQDKLAIGR